MAGSMQLGGSRFLPSIILHDKPRHWLNRFLFENETLALIPAPSLFILAHAAQPDFVGQMLAREREQSPAEVLALIFWRNEQHVEIEGRQMQGQHRRELPVVIGDKQAPALLDFA